MAASSQESLDILESALDQAFSAPPRPPPKEVAQESTSVPSEEPAESSLAESVQEVVLSESVASDDTWKAEYEAQVQSWRARSAEEREKAEKERLKWEGIRAIEREEAAKRKAAGIVDVVPEPSPSHAHHEEEHWENVKASSESNTAESISSKTESLPSEVKVDSQEAPSGSAEALPRTHSHQDTLTDESQKWEDVPSVTSSFPSLSFPEHTDTPSPPHPQSKSQPAIVTASQAIFDSSLSTRTRITAVIASLSVNLFLPFVNGVMLGFGEIFAKNVVMQWFGWKPSGPASSVTNVGIRSSPREERQKRALW